MSHYRKTFRDLAAAALMDDVAFDAFQKLSGWAHNIDATELPVLGVATPHETKDRDTHDGSTRDTRMIVVLKILGGDDIEDALDDFSESVEQIVIPALAAENIECDLRTTTTNVDGGGETRVGTLSMEFAVMTWLAEPLAD